jgi:hypothetical protein
MLLRIYGWFMRRRARRQNERFAELFSDPVLGSLQWEGHGNGNWWVVDIERGGHRIPLRVGGDTRPDPVCILKARAIAGGLDKLLADLPWMLRIELRNQPSRACVIRQLTLRAICIFPTKDRHPDGYAGDFIILEPRQGSTHPWHEWRADLENGGYANLRRW